MVAILIKLLKGIPRRAMRETFLPVGMAFIVFFLQGFGAARHDSPTYDEPIHLASGYLYLRTGAYWLDTSSPPLARVIVAVPLLFMSLPLSGQDLVLAEHDPVVFASSFVSQNRIPMDTLFLFARTMILLIGFFLMVVLWAWAKEVFGKKAAFASLLFFATCPPLIAHAHLVTVDFAFTAAFITTLWGYWEFLKNPERRTTAFLTGIALGAALNIKYSAFSLFAIMPCLFLLEHPWTTHRWQTLCTGMVFVATTTFSICIPFYVFNWSMVTRGVHIMQAYNVLGWPSFLLGHYSTRGWWCYSLSFTLQNTADPSARLLRKFMGC